MKNLLYIGNKLVSTGKTSTTIDTLGKNLESIGFKVKYASSYKNIVIRFLDMLWAVFKYRKTTDYVLIDTYSTLNFYYAYAVSKLCVFFKLKYIPILHGGNLPERLKKSPKKSAAIFKNAFINIAPSNYIKTSFEAFNYSNLKVIPNSISIKKYTFNSREINDIKLLWVRSFSEIYNPMLAVKIVKTLQDEGFKASLCMVGPENDGFLEKTKQYAQKLSVNVFFTGKLTKTEWIELSKKYNIFINTTNFDNMPVSVIEAMALGLPVISTNVGGIPFLIENNYTGILVKPNSVNEFIQAIKRLKNDTDKTIEIINRAREKSEMFDFYKVASEWKKLLK